MVAAAVVFLLALTWGGGAFPGRRPRPSPCWRLGPAVGPVRGRLARAPEPFLPLAMLREPVVGAPRDRVLPIGTIIGITIIVPLYLELVLGLNASQSSLALIALVAGTTVGSVIAGRLLARM